MKQKLTCKEKLVHGTPGIRLHILNCDDKHSNIIEYNHIFTYKF